MTVKIFNYFFFFDNIISVTMSPAAATRPITAIIIYLIIDEYESLLSFFDEGFLFPSDNVFEIMFSALSVS